MSEPLRTVSESESGLFSISFTLIQPGTHILTLPAGSYFSAATFLGPGSSVPSVVYLYLRCRNYNEALPPEAGLQLIQRFEYQSDTQGGNRWVREPIELEVTSPNGRELVMNVGTTVPNAPFVYMLKLWAHE